VPVEDFYLWGSCLYFTLPEQPPRWTKLHYGGLIEGDQIAGTWRMGDGKPSSWTARRSP